MVEAAEEEDALDDAESDAPEPDVPELAVSLDVDPLDSPLVTAPLLPVGAGPLPLLRKSVTYQPLPLSWKPAAVTCLRNVSLLHSGHTDKGGSEILRKISCAKPHDSHR